MKTPREVVMAVRNAAAQAMNDAAISKRLADLGYVVVGDQPDEFGAACAFLCSAHAGFITGQNLLMDGGQYPGTY